MCRRAETRYNLARRPRSLGSPSAPWNRRRANRGNRQQSAHPIPPTGRSYKGSVFRPARTRANDACRPCAPDPRRSRGSKRRPTQTRGGAGRSCPVRKRSLHPCSRFRPARRAPYKALTLVPPRHRSSSACHRRRIQETGCPGTRKATMPPPCWVTAKQSAHRASAPRDSPCRRRRLHQTPAAYRQEK